METPTPEQLKAEVAERDSVLAETLINERKNKELIKDNNLLTPKVADLKQQIFILDGQIATKKKMITDAGQHRVEITKLLKTKTELSEEILRIQNDPEILSLVAQKNKILKEIADLGTEKSILFTANIELADSNTEIQTQIHRGEGRLIELNKKEEEFKNLLSTETAGLIAEKTKLQAEIPALKKEVGSLHSEKDLLVGTIKTLAEIHEKVFEKVGTMESAISLVKDTSDKNIVSIEELFKELTDGLTKLLDKSKESTASADVILEKLPKWIFELQRPVSLKRIPPRMINRVMPEGQKEHELPL